uniref:Uncharacterized protein n=1 Tax=Fusarium oxysporum (strain Fo5176) TaxID=660025 RepID=A0A0D2XLY6_FUSOF
MVVLGPECYADAIVSRYMLFGVRCFSTDEKDSQMPQSDLRIVCRHQILEELCSLLDLGSFTFVQSVYQNIVSYRELDKSLDELLSQLCIYEVGASTCDLFLVAKGDYIIFGLYHL